MTEDKQVILKVLVGSQAHKLADVNSDIDYRAVYVLPTRDILSLNYRYKGNSWVEGTADNTSYEISHFLWLATKCNPSILEVFRAPVVEANEDGGRLRDLFPYVWNPKDAFNAFTGYSLNQRKKFLAKKDKREDKYAVAYIRTLFNLIELLRTEDFSVEIRDSLLKDRLKRYKAKMYTPGEVIDYAEKLTGIAEGLLEHCKHEPNLEKVNDFLVDIRKRYWGDK